MFASRALCVTSTDDVIQLPSELQKHWKYIKEHYQRVGLECCEEVIWDLNLDRIKNYPKAELSPFFFGVRENIFRPDERRFLITKYLNSKNNFIKLAQKENINTPVTIAFNSIDDLKKYKLPLDFPLYFKPEVSLSGLGICRCESISELEKHTSKIKEKFAFQLQKEINSTCFLNFQFEEIDGKAHRLLISQQVIEDNSHLGNFYPIKYGNSDFLDNFAQSMVDQGMRGIFAFDVAVIENDHKTSFFAIECNPRFNAATYPAIVSKKLNITQWMTLTLSASFDSYDDLLLQDIEFRTDSNCGIIIINWGSIEHGKIMFMIAGNPQEQKKFLAELKNRINIKNQKAMSLILLTPKQIARITGGEWRNCDVEKLKITGINHYLPYTQSGDLYFDLRKESELTQDLSNDRITKAYAKGVTAVVSSASALKNNLRAFLEVTHPAKALQDIATATSLQFDGVKIQVIGSHGKTGFKTQLHHLLTGQIRAHAHLDSSNLQNPVMRALAAIPRDADLAIIETAIPVAGIGEDRSFFIRPNFCMFTGIGFEHLASHGSVEQLIVNKATAVVGLRPNGASILNADDFYFSLLEEKIRSLSNCKIYKFGSNSDCDGQLIEAIYENFQWSITARILDEDISYSLPLIEDYAPLASVSVLLMTKLVGANIEKCAARYQSYTHFESSGNLYEVQRENGSFKIYDQSRRGEWKGFLSMFELMSRIKPTGNGRKIAVISELINIEDNPGAPIDLAVMKVIIEKAGISCLFTVADFKKHQAALPEKMNWIQHEDDGSKIKQSVLDCVRENDLVFVRGVEKARLDKLVTALLQSGSSVKKLR